MDTLPVEKQPTPESSSQDEAQQAPEQPSGSPPQQDEPTAPPTPAASDDTTPASPPVNVVDKTDTPTQLHDIKNTKDKLTKEADEEEERFIEEVEKHHGHL